MAVHEIYIGGPSGTNASRNRYPAPTFSASAAGFSNATVAAHKGPTQFALTRVIDVANDKQLRNYLQSATVALSDDLGAILIPKNVLFYGIFVRVLTPVADLELTPSLRDASVSFPAIDCSVASDGGFAVPGAVAYVTNGATTLASARFCNAADILDLSITGIGYAGLGSLRLEVSPLVSELSRGQY